MILQALPVMHAHHTHSAVSLSVGPCWHQCWIVLSHLELLHASRQT